ncbi:MAG: alpha/beta hydrolase [Propionibacterium sp.]|nr:alpha/beta hydrolase [Propionibacterium sp.]
MTPTRDAEGFDPDLAAAMPGGDRASAVTHPRPERERRRAERAGVDEDLVRRSFRVSTEDVEIGPGDAEIAPRADAMVARLGPAVHGGAVRMRLYRPRATHVRGTVLYLHGGAFVFGDIDDSARQCAEISSATGGVVAMVDYRLAPENPYPAALVDCAHALAWLAGPGGADRVSVVGSSAGGNLAAALTLLARDSHVDLLGCQVLLNPVLDPELATGSMVAFDTTPGWNGAACRAMWRQYLPGRPWQDLAYAAPGRVADVSGLPPALIVTAERDPLRDEGIAYGQRLLAAGGSVELYNAPGAFHGFLAAAPDADVSRRAMSLVTGALRRFGGSPPSAR